MTDSGNDGWLNPNRKMVDLVRRRQKAKTREEVLADQKAKRDERSRIARERKGIAKKLAVLDPENTREDFYREDFVQIALDVTERGGTAGDVAAILGISTKQLGIWRGLYPSFDRAVTLGLEAATRKVTQALYHRAVGYSYTAERIVVNRETGESETVMWQEHLPPDTQAAIFWLTNRAADEWKSTREVKHVKTHDLDSLTDAELYQIAKRAKPKVIDGAVNDDRSGSGAEEGRAGGGGGSDPAPAGDPKLNGGVGEA